MLLAWLGMVLAGAFLLGCMAAASGYLLVIRSRRHALIVMERGSDERYHLLRLRTLPVALLRYAALAAAYSLLLLHRRTQGRSRKPVPLAVKA